MWFDSNLDPNPAQFWSFTNIITFSFVWYSIELSASANEWMCVRVCQCMNVCVRLFRVYAMSFLSFLVYMCVFFSSRRDS